MSSRRTDDPSALVLEQNRMAMERLKLGQYQSAIALLKQSEVQLEFLPSFWKLQAITYNNLGCYYKKTRDPEQALYYLKLALDIEIKHPEDYTNIAGTHLNQCAVYSQLGRHKSALKQAQRALQVLKAHFQQSPNLVTTMAISLHNIGVEFEYLRLRKPAAEAYSDGWDFAKKELGVSHPLTTSLKRSFQACMDQKPLLEPPRILPPVEFTPKTTNSKTVNRVSPLFHPPWEGLPLLSSRSDKKPGSKTNQSYSESHPDNSFIKNKPSVLGPNLRFISGDRKQPMFSGVPTPVSQVLKTTGIKGLKSSEFGNRHRSVQVELPTPIPSEKKTSAAIVIQRFVRGFTARRKMRTLIANQQREKIELAGEMAKKALEEVQRLRSELIEQKSMNQKRTPKKGKVGFKPVTETENAASIIIQSGVRMFLARCRSNHRRTAILTIQKTWRMVIVRSLYRSIREAIIFIQACYRGHKAREFVKDLKARIRLKKGKKGPR